MATRSDAIRNVVLFGHSSSGKTAIIDALAFGTKASSRHGDVAAGTSVSNAEPEEKERKQTLSSHLFAFPLDGGMQLNVIDTPGHQDFLGDTISSMYVVETGVLCASATSHVTFHARRLWKEAGKANLGRAVVVTHVEAENTDFGNTLEELQKFFGDIVVPLTYPNASGPGFDTVHSVLDGEGPEAQAYREKLEERVAEADDKLLETYLESGTLDPQALADNLQAAVARGKLVPLFVVSGPKMLGVDALLRLVPRVLPSPESYGPRAVAAKADGAYDQLLPPDLDGPFAARVFKVVVDPYVGRLAYLRCFRGHIKLEEGFLNVRTGKHEKIGSLLGLKGHETKPITLVETGDVFCVGKIESLNHGDAVTADGAPCYFAPIDFPEPVFSLAVQPASRGDEQKIGQGLEKLHIEDPTLRLRRDENTGEMVVAGMSPLHIDVHLSRLKRRYGIGTVTHAPRVPYKETITAKADGHHRHKKQSGGRGQFAEVYLRVAPVERGKGFEFVNSVVGGSIPKQFIPEIEKGVRKFLAKGPLAGCVVEDVQVEIYDGKFHEVDSDQISFQLAGERAVADAFAKARPILLEPYMDVEIHVPERFTGDVAGNLSSSRGRMSGMEMHEGDQVIKAQVPLKEMQDYATHLRSITAGEGSFSMRASHYEMVPPNVQQEIVAAYERDHAEAASH
ncbi:MAG: elongation factor G [Planctomycetota bacterium]